MATTLVTKKFRSFAANAFSKSFDSDSIYFTIGATKKSSFAVDSDTNLISSENLARDLWSRSAGAFRITSNKVAQGIKRNDWSVGTVYTQYSSNSDLFSASSNGYYVLAGTTNRDVYKCLDNSADSKSTVKPTQKDLAPYREYDGYIWKYMYSISESDWNSFATEYVIPVKTDPKVSAAAVAGSIINISIIGANNLVGIGSNYRSSNFPNGYYGEPLTNLRVSHNYDDPSIDELNEFRVEWDSTISDNPPNHYFTNCVVMFTSGILNGTITKITNYKRTGKQLIVEDAVSSSIAVGDTLKIGPEVTLQNDSGGGRFKGIAETNTWGNVTSILVGNIGTGYSNTTLTANISPIWRADTLDWTPIGAGAYGRVELPPPGGHGYNAFEELNAKYVIINAETPKGGSTDDALTPDYGPPGQTVDFYQVGLLRNPIDPLTQEIAIGSIYDLRTHIMFNDSITTYSSLVSNFSADTNITNANNQAKATVWKVGGSGATATIPVLSLVNTEGTFANGQYIQNPAGILEQIWSVNAYAWTGKVRGKETQNTVAVYPEQLTKYSGEVLYVDNIDAVTRHKDQSETFKLIFEF